MIVVMLTESAYLTVHYKLARLWTPGASGTRRVWDLAGPQDALTKLAWLDVR